MKDPEYVKKAVLWSAAIITAAMAVYPPWIQEYFSEELHLGPTAGSYSWILKNPGPISGWTSRVDVARLLIQWAATWVLAGAAFYGLGKRTIDPPGKPSPAGEVIPGAKPAIRPSESTAPTVATTSSLSLAMCQVATAGYAEGETLWRDLLIKVLHDEAKAVRLVQFELDELKRKGIPEIPIVALIKRATERWERDNAG